MELLVGADPEIFLRNAAGFQSGYNVIPGTKKAPHPVKDGAVQVDGMAVEFNIDPAGSEKDFLHNVQSVLHTLRQMVPQEYELDISPVAEFTEEIMAMQPEEAKRLGCDPDFNAYTAAANPAPDQHPTMRTAAGHVHLGWCKDRDVQDHKHVMSCCELVKQLDAFLGLPSVILDPDKKRKQMYGKAGAFRPKPYGLEYRVMSNFWVKDEKLMKLVYRNTQEAFEQLVRHGKAVSRGVYENVVQEIINTNDVRKAKIYCDYWHIPTSVR